MKNDKAAARPWQFYKKLSASENCHGYTIVSKSKIGEIADVSPGDSDGIAGEANAAFIIRAANGYDPIKLALREALDIADADIADGMEAIIALNSLRPFLRQALRDY